MQRRIRAQARHKMLRVYNPCIPFEEPLLEPLQIGMVFTFTGSVPHYAKRFSINFQCGRQVSGWPTPPKAFHFNPRFDERIVVRNTFNNSWGPEERNGSFPFQQGGTFVITIKIANNYYRVSVNSQPFVDYAHRMGISRVNTITIQGDVAIHEVSANNQAAKFNNWKSTPDLTTSTVFQQIGYTGTLAASRNNISNPVIVSKMVRTTGQAAAQPKQSAVDLLVDLQAPIQPSSSFATYVLPPAKNSAYPIHLINPGTPAIVNFPGNLAVGLTIYMSATPTGSSFGVYFEKGVDVAFLFNPRFIAPMVYSRTQSTVVRNSLQNGQWGTEERQLQTSFPFQLNVQFDLLIKVLPDHYDVSINGLKLVTFPHRIFPLSQITNMAVKGDIKIASIYMQM